MPSYGYGATQRRHEPGAEYQDEHDETPDGEAVPHETAPSVGPLAAGLDLQPALVGKAPVVQRRRAERPLRRERPVRFE